VIDYHETCNANRVRVSRRSLSIGILAGKFYVTSHGEIPRSVEAKSTLKRDSYECASLEQVIERLDFPLCKSSKSRSLRANCSSRFPDFHSNKCFALNEPRRTKDEISSGRYANAAFDNNINYLKFKVRVSIFHLLCALTNATCSSRFHA